MMHFLLKSLACYLVVRDISRMTECAALSVFFLINANGLNHRNS